MRSDVRAEEQALDLPFELQPSGKFAIALPSGKDIELPICRPIFERWKGAKVQFSYGGKQMLNYENEACFAELVILRLLLASGWDGVWVEVFGGPHFIRAMPDGWKLKSKHVSIPVQKEQFLKDIWASAKSLACFDIFAWKDNSILFCEAKRARRDRLTQPQLKFIQGALKCGVPRDALLVVEWTTFG